MSNADLRPLSLGELLDKAFSYYRQHFWLFVGIMAIPQVFAVAVNLFTQVFRTANFTTATPQDPARVMAGLSNFMAVFVTGFIITGVVYLLCYAVALGATTFAISEVHLGRPVGVRDAYRRLRGKMLRLFGLMLLFMLIAIGAFVLVMLGAVALPAIIGFGLRMAFGPGPLAGAVAGLLFACLALVGMLLALILLLRYSVAVPALVLENISPRRALSRSALLTKGSLWRIFVAGFLMWIIAVVIALLFQGPFWVAGAVLGFKFGIMPSWLTVPMAIAGGLGSAVSGPLLVIVLALLYYDTRVRKEAFDLELIMASIDQRVPPAPPATGFATLGP